MLALVRAARSTWVLVLALVVGGDVARAQDPVPSASPPAPESPTPASPAPPVSGVPPIATGFTPDPLRLSGTTQGARPLSGIAPGCRGYVGAEPDHVVTLARRFGFLRFFVTAASDVTLALRAPDGRWHCAGRPLGGAPREEGRWAEGRYEVWIGSTQPDGHVAYELNVTEFRSVGPATSRGETGVISGGQEVGLSVDAERGRFRDRRLRRGFLPDPVTDGGTAGGEVDVAALGGGCRGRVDPQPAHVLTLADDFDYLRIAVVDAPGPVTLIVRAPTGAYLCSTPDEGLPAIVQDAWVAGRYLVWVGTRDVSAPTYRLEYSETRPSGED